MLQKYKIIYEDLVDCVISIEDQLREFCFRAVLLDPNLVSVSECIYWGVQKQPIKPPGKRPYTCEMTDKYLFLPVEQLLQIVFRCSVKFRTDFFYLLFSIVRILFRKISLSVVPLVHEGISVRYVFLPRLFLLSNLIV